MLQTVGRSAQGATVQADVLIIGAGLSSSLLALMLAQHRPGLSLCILERAQAADAGHTWCLFEPDVTSSQWQWLAPLFARQWPGYEVAFPGYQRPLRTRYGCITSAHLAQQVTARLPGIIHHGAAVEHIGATEVVCADGRRFAAPLIVDARGPAATPSLQLAWQKFIGMEIRLKRPHGLRVPIVMDASVPQLEGYRFMYVLPFDDHRLLVEDTRYSDDAHLDARHFESEIHSYVAARGWEPAEVVRTERGVLPIVLGGDIGRFWEEREGQACIGLRGAFFHPTTGYSLPEAVRTAEWLAAQPDLRTPAIAAGLRRRSLQLWKRGAYYRALNRMMFLAAAPDQRYRVLERFYRLPGGLIERFYAGRASWLDRLHTVMGRPPVPVLAALRALRERSVTAASA